MSGVQTQLTEEAKLFLARRLVTDIEIMAAYRNLAVYEADARLVARWFLALADAYSVKDRAIREARRELWWFIERDTGDGWGFTDEDAGEIAARAMRIQDEVLCPAVSVGSPETRETEE